MLDFTAKYLLHFIDAIVLVYYFNKTAGVWNHLKKRTKVAAYIGFAVLARIAYLPLTALIVCLFCLMCPKIQLKKALSAICIISIVNCWRAIFFELHYFYASAPWITSLFDAAENVGFWLILLGLTHWKTEDTEHTILNMKMFVMMSIIPCMGILWTFMIPTYWVDISSDFLIERNDWYYQFPICILFIVFDILICYLYYAFENRQNELRLSAKREEQVKLQLEQYEKMKEVHRHILSVKHDVSNHLLSMQTLLNAGRIEDAKQLLAGLTNRFEDIRFVAYTGNGAIDSILNLEREKANMIHADFAVNAAIPSDIQIDQEKITTILGNLLDNAIEACKKCRDDRKIEISLSYINLALIIQVKNTFDGGSDENAELSLEQLATTKQNKAYHGFGLQNVKTAVEKIGGSMEIHMERPWFYARVILYDQTNEEK